MAISYKKREIEKKKAQKKKEKLRRREERKAEAPDSFAEMIAYVDANGNICDTPPEPDVVEEIELEDIQISIPKKEVSEDERPKGIVKFFDDKKGIGFISQSESPNDIFFHCSNAPKSIKQGDEVNFDIESGPRGLNAVCIEYCNTVE
ncbi:MAG: cold shock domain-containing protein [Porphyromonadaceae bacterium]|nr:cold shock domain-containing protein [Porphyromonadaceae bacterium]